MPGQRRPMRLPPSAPSWAAVPARPWRVHSRPRQHCDQGAPDRAIHAGKVPPPQSCRRWFPPTPGSSCPRPRRQSPLPSAPRPAGSGQVPGARPKPPLGPGRPAHLRIGAGWRAATRAVREAGLRPGHSSIALSRSASAISRDISAGEPKWLAAGSKRPRRGPPRSVLSRAAKRSSARR